MENTAKIAVVTGSNRGIGLALAEALFKELRYDGIKVTCINPGSVDTDLIKGLGIAGHPLAPADVADAVLYCLESRSNSLPSEIDLRPLKPKG